MAKILVVEDDIELANIVLDALEREGHEVETVSDGLEAAARLEKSNYELIVLDLWLPGKSGVDVCKGYRDGGGRASVLMLTGKTEIHEKEEGLDAGADDYLTKPFDLRELHARIRALLRRPRKQPYTLQS